MRTVLITAAVMLVLLSTGVARAEIIGTYVDATTDNTDNAAGGADSTWSTNNDSTTDNLWRYPAKSGHASWLVFGNGSAIEAYGGTETSVPTLATTISGLAAGSSYEVRLLFGNHSASGNDYSIKGGLSASSLATYNSSNSDLAVAGAFAYEGGTMNLRQALLGTTTADSNGSITAYIAASSAGVGNGRALYDGVSYHAVPEPNSIVLSMAGLFSLLAYAWRKRQ